ncbi:hypothetical protein CRUP_029081 [Coryphaenoides rupestris]|nr:hypothetical protein CRUP_029081 [Coryphaenoides rupestris]
MLQLLSGTQAALWRHLVATAVTAGCSQIYQEWVESSHLHLQLISEGVSPEHHLECLQSTRSLSRAPGVSPEHQECLQSTTRSLSRAPGVSPEHQECLQSTTRSLSRAPPGVSPERHQECLQSTTRSVSRAPPGVSPERHQECLQSATWSVSRASGVSPEHHQECLQTTRWVTVATPQHLTPRYRMRDGETFGLHFGLSVGHVTGSLTTTRFLPQCLERYVELLLSDGLGSEVSCPDAACPQRGRLLDAEIEAAVGPDPMRRYRRLRFEREVLLDPCRTWCPALSCQAVCQLTEGAESAAESAAAAPPPNAVCCPACRLEFCSGCLAQWHRGRACRTPAGSKTARSHFLSGESRALLQGGEEEEEEEDLEVKRCPDCHVYIQRDEGCAQMVCRICKHSFCWHCLHSLDDDFLLLHFDKGPCRNKLGHSRASVIWHRTQVRRELAGFGVVLLATSPLLLLATPLLFCCRWRCRRRDDDPLPT